MYQKMGLVIVYLFAFLLFPSFMHAEFPDTKLFKGKIETVNQKIEWNYESPLTYEYILQDQRYMGGKAEKEINHLFNLLAISKNSSVEDIIKALEENGYNSVTHLDVRWINGDNELYSWVWNKN